MISADRGLLAQDEQAPLRLSFNGRFLAARPTGVQRVARGLLRAVDGLLQTSEPNSRAELLKPRGAMVDFSLNNIPVRTVGRLAGVAWEQMELPGGVRGANLVNMCNAAPLNCDSAVTLIHDAQVFLAPTSYNPTFVQWYRYSLPRIAKRARVVATVSEFSRQQLIACGVSDEAHTLVLYNGADHVLDIEPLPEALAELELGDIPYAVVFGNLQAHKNLAVVLAAFASPRLRGVRLVVVGPVTREQAADRLKVVAPTSTLFAGRLADGALRALLEGARLLVMPSLTEGFGLPALEAMTLGVPVVVSPNGALPEVCGEGAIYADPHDPHSWAEQIASLFEDDLLHADMRSRALQQASRFRWRASAKRLLQLVRAG